ncbi:G-protein coupled receptor 157-like isoform X1 [Acropora muricata]|uniref:G-protein coupled receptor 157-like isoform X1 n=2 Tax=Acropora muricata TaxID=159855 RepID=UPI0034E5FC80
MESALLNSFDQFKSETGIPQQAQAAHTSVNRILSTTVAFLSMVGAVIIVVTFIVYPDIRTNSRRIIVYISISDFSVACLNTVGLYNPATSDSKLTCKLQATLTVVAVLSSFLWTVNLSLYFYMTICKKISTAAEKRMMTLFHVTAWGFPITIAVFAYGLHGVGYTRDMVSSGWCWISTDKPWWQVVLWMSLTGKAWEISAYIVISVLFALVKQEMARGLIPRRHLLTPKALEVVKKADRKFKFIPIVFILLRIWGTIRFFRFLAYHPEDPPLLKWLVVLHGVGDNSQGFANFVLFCLFTDKIKEKFKLGCNSVKPYCFRIPNKNQVLDSQSTNFPLNTTSDLSSYGAGDFVTLTAYSV